MYQSSDSLWNEAVQVPFLVALRPWEVLARGFGAVGLKPQHSVMSLDRRGDHECSMQVAHRLAPAYFEWNQGTDWAQGADRSLKSPRDQCCSFGRGMERRS